MGCAASAQPREREGHNDSDSDAHSNVSSASRNSNKFTTEYASRRPASNTGSPVFGRPIAPYTPAFPDDVMPWGKNQCQEEKREEKIVENFVFGDFVVDPGDVQQQRIERINRHRIERKNSIKNLHPPSGWFNMNDFNVKIDEGEEFESSQLKEMSDPPIPSGFRMLKGMKVENIVGHNSRVKTVALAPHEKYVASSAMEDTAINLVEGNHGEDVSTLVGHLSPIISASFSKDGRYLATSSRDNTIIIWDASASRDPNKRQVRCLEHPSLPICCTFSNNGVSLVVGCQNRQCFVWDIGRGVEALCYEEHEAVVVCAAIMPGEDLTATAGGDRIIRLWNIHSGENIRQFIGHDGVIISLNFTPDAEKILSNDDRACKMWNVATAACVLNVTLESLTRLPKADHRPPQPLSDSYFDKYAKYKLPARTYGFGTNGILGPSAMSACRIAAHRAVFTVSCLCPGDLATSYFAVASTNKTVYIVSCVTGKEEISAVAKSAVFALAAGRGNKIVFGDIFGNVYKMTLRSGESK